MGQREAFTCASHLSTFPQCPRLLCWASYGAGMALAFGIAPKEACLGGWMQLGEPAHFPRVLKAPGARAVHRRGAAGTDTWLFACQSVIMEGSRVGHSPRGLLRGGDLSAQGQGLHSGQGSLLAQLCAGSEQGPAIWLWTWYVGLKRLTQSLGVAPTCLLWMRGHVIPDFRRMGPRPENPQGGDASAWPQPAEG